MQHDNNVKMSNLGFLEGNIIRKCGGCFSAGEITHWVQRIWCGSNETGPIIVFIVSAFFRS